MRAASLYEAFIVACNLKAEEIDSEWTRPGPNTMCARARLPIRSSFAMSRSPNAVHGTRKAMDAAENGNLASLIELWLEVKEAGRLTERLNRASDGELEGLSHFVTEPAVKAHVRAHPAVAARLFRALCMRILNSGKSKYYYAALANLEEARRC